MLLALICIEFSVAGEMSTLSRQDIENWQVRDEFNDYDQVDWALNKAPNQTSSLGMTKSIGKGF